MRDPVKGMVGIVHFLFSYVGARRDFNKGEQLEGMTLQYRSNGINKNAAV